MEKQNITKGGKVMKNRIWLIAVMVMVAGLLFASFASAQQFPILDRIAEKVIQKYQTSNCEQLWSKRASQSPRRRNELCRF